jgi:hypothetical protein
MRSIDAWMLDARMKDDSLGSRCTGSMQRESAALSERATSIHATHPATTSTSCGRHA